MCCIASLCFAAFHVHVALLLLLIYLLSNLREHRGIARGGLEPSLFFVGFAIAFARVLSAELELQELLSGGGQVFAVLLPVRFGRRAPRECVFPGWPRDASAVSVVVFGVL